MINARSSLTATLLLISAVSATADPATVNTKLNLRSGPGQAFNIIAVVRSGTRLDVQNCGEEWCRVALGRQTGYASRALLQIGVDSYASAAAPPAPADAKPTLTGPTVWQWRDQQWRDAHWRLLDWHNRMNAR